MTMRLELFTSNIEQTVNFYKNVLGFKSLKSSISTYQPIQNGQVVLGIGLIENLGNDHYFNPNQIDIQYGFGVEIVLEVEDIKFIYNKVKMADIEIESELKKQPWGLTDFRLVDPNGYYIRVTSKK
ncbi:VOC family protein [Aureisphaera sp. CAU 1614]|uniref:VOC family protein n=2 Tax=Halomarinibacterium sedimenti TaxID=2857106 RepID=A0A9X1FM04_9FLAO|nr:VOC family protein [Halomarinibacterium sedimenti]